MKSNLMFGSRNKQNEDNPFDFYETPKYGTETFLKNFKIPNIDAKILEPCNGNGGISNVLIEHGYENITTMDINPEYNCDITTNFLNYLPKNEFDIIITNPPFKGNYNAEFIEKALRIVKDNGYVIFLMKLLYLEAKKRKEFFQQNPPKYIFVHSTRLNFDGKTGVCYAWYVWQKGYKGETILRLI